MNMLLHGISIANLQNDDTLAEPRHVEAGRAWDRRGRDLTAVAHDFTRDYPKHGRPRQACQQSCSALTLQASVGEGTKACARAALDVTESG
jgi:hypothetical protein